MTDLSKLISTDDVLGCEPQFSLFAVRGQCIVSLVPVVDRRWGFPVFHCIKRLSWLALIHTLPDWRSHIPSNLPGRLRPDDQRMSCRNNQRLTSTRINMERSGSSEDNPVMRKTDKQEPENPITIVMSLEILFNEEEQPGPAFPFVKALSAVNDVLRNCDPESKELFKVLFIHDNKNLEQKINTNHNLLAELKDIITPLAVSEERLIDELQKNKTDLYLSASPQSSQEVMKQGIAAAVMLTPEKTMDVKGTPLRLVFDGDAVIFSNESECIFAKGGLKEYMDNEAEKVDHPLSEGPFKNFLEALGKLQKKFKERDCPIRTYLVTSRDAGNAGYRAMNTLKLWGLEIDEAYFLKGSPKGPVLKVIAPHIFFDDIEDHAKGALKEGVVACHVQY